MYEYQWREHIRCVRYDNDTEFVNMTLDGIFLRNGIVH